MGFSFFDIMMALEPIIYLAAVLPFLIAVTTWIVFYIKYDRQKLGVIAETFKMLATKGEKIEGCSKDNISFMDIDDAPVYFSDAFSKMKLQIENNYKGDFIPEGKHFYDFDSLITIPCNRSQLNTVWKNFWVLVIVTVLLPFVVALFVQPMYSSGALVMGIMALLLLCMAYLFFTMLDRRIYSYATDQYHNFISNFDRVLPVTKPEVALLIEATKRNRDTFESSTKRIEDKFDSIVDSVLLPALEDSISVIMHSNLIPAIQNFEKTLDNNLSRTSRLHEEGMRNMTSAFADRLTDAVEGRLMILAGSIDGIRTNLDMLNQSMSDDINNWKDATKMGIEMQDERIEQMLSHQDHRIDQMMDLQAKHMAGIATSFTDSITDTLTGTIAELNNEIGQVQILMNSLNEKLGISIDDLSGMLKDQQKLMADSAEMLTKSGETQEKNLSDTKEIQTRAEENTRILNDHVNTMTEILAGLTEQNTAFTEEAFKFTKETSQVQMRMAEDVKLSQEKLEAAVNETMSQYSKMNSMISDMMDNITGRMNKAMAGAGKEIALGIKEVTADNAKAIADLTEQAQSLRDDYEAYFERLEQSSLKIIDDMDYQIRTIIVRITEDIGSMMEENIKANADILERYKDNTTDLLQSFDEQARSIGLYAKEINIDVTELTGSLRVSVEEFSTKMQEGVRMTLTEFDDGLSELTHRIANTVESISDAVEALPEAISKV